MTEIRNHHVAQLGGIEVRESGAGSQFVTMRGEAAVFNSDSHDLGGFTERIMPGAFREILASNPDVPLVSQHDQGRPLARTRNGTLELRETPQGLHVWARINTATSYGADEVVKLRDGLVDGMSFAFTVDPSGESWKTREDGTILREITQVSGLYDVSIVTQGAYPAAHAELVRSYERAVSEGRAPAGHSIVAAHLPGDPAVAVEGQLTESDRRAHMAQRLAVANAKSLNI